MDYQHYHSSCATVKHHHHCPAHALVDHHWHVHHAGMDVCNCCCCCYWSLSLPRLCNPCLKQLRRVSPAQPLSASKTQALARKSSPSLRESCMTNLCINKMRSQHANGAHQRQACILLLRLSHLISSPQCRWTAQHGLSQERVLDSRIQGEQRHPVCLSAPPGAHAQQLTFIYIIYITSHLLCLSL